MAVANNPYRVIIPAVVEGAATVASFLSRS